MSRIALTQRLFAEVDEADLDRLIHYRWHAKIGRGVAYAQNNAVGTMHRFLMRPSKGLVVNHKDGNGLNNHRANLEVCSNSLNILLGRFEPGVSGYRGVYPYSGGRFVATIRVAGKKKHIGIFASAKEAAEAVDAEIKASALALRKANG